MSLKVQQQPTEIDHIRDTLTNLVDVVGDTRKDLRQLDEKVTENHKLVLAIHEEVVTNQKEVSSRLDQQDSDISEIKDTLKLILSRLPA